MEKEKFKKKDGLTSLNENLYNEFSIEKLEERLETDPLMVGLDLLSDVNANDLCDGNFACADFTCRSYLCYEFVG